MKCLFLFSLWIQFLPFDSSQTALSSGAHGALPYVARRMQLAATSPPHTAPAAAAAASTVPIAPHHAGADLLAARRGHVAPLPAAGPLVGQASAAARAQSLGIAGNGVCLCMCVVHIFILI